MNEEQIFDKIDAYLWDMLPKNERLAFENDLKTDEALRSELALRRLENEAIRLKEKDDLRSKMKAWKAEAVISSPVETTPEAKVISLNQNQVRRFSLVRLAAAAAMFIGVLFAGNFWLNSNYSNDALVSEFYGQSGSILRGSRGDLPTTFDQAMQLMQAGKYQEAIPILENINDSANFVTTRFTLGEAYFKLKNYEQAQVYYRQIIERNETAVSVQEAEWKTLLTLLASNKTGEPFESLLNRISTDNNHSFQRKALDLKAKMDSMWRNFIN
jgi:tetratricopeptide (TPR) repeat protein